jgi:hypothetical protein
MSGGLSLLRDSSPEAQKQLQETGHTQDELRRTVDDDMYSWRAEVCLLYFDGADLLGMTDVEYRAAAAAYARYNEKVRKLEQSKHSVDQVAGKGAEYQRRLRTGSPPNTIGIVALAAFAASAPTSVSVKITAARRRTSSAASVGKRLYCASEDR